MAFWTGRWVVAVALAGMSLVPAGATLCAILCVPVHAAALTAAPPDDGSGHCHQPADATVPLLGSSPHECAPHDGARLDSVARFSAGRADTDARRLSGHGPAVRMFVLDTRLLDGLPTSGTPPGPPRPTRASPVLRI